MNYKSWNNLTLEQRNIIKEYLNKIDQLTNNWNELEEWVNIQLKIVEENIIESTKWLEIEEEKEHTKNDIHTAKIIKRYMLYILNKMKEIKERKNENI